MPAAKKKTPAKKRRKQQPKRKSHWFWRLLKWGLYATLLVAIVLAGYLWTIDRQITEVFEGRRWSVPATVYAQPLELYPGLLLKQSAFVEELTRSGYIERSNAQTPGSYSIDRGTVNVHLRAFRFIDRARPSERIKVAFKKQGIYSLAYADGRGLPLVRLDPPTIGSFFPSHGEDRLILTPDQVPTLLTAGLKAVEDRNFDRHVGFSIRGIIRAMWTNLRQGEVTQGGSTLTQQLVKSYFLDNRRTVERKLKEVAMAIVLDARFSKEDLLTAYVNEIFLGQSGNRAIHGFGLGAQFYFNKPLQELDAAEVATLIAIIRGPSYYNPVRHPKRVTDRRNRVLGILKSDKLINDKVYDQAIAKPLNIVRGARRGGGYYPAFMDLVRRSLAEQYSRRDLESQGLNIHTSLDPRVQDAAQAALTQQLDALENRRNIEKLEGAVVVADSQTGELLAVVGGRRAGFDGFNRALNAKRPIGSLMKPLVVLTALAQGQQLTDIVQDEAVSLQQDSGEMWTPRNFDREVHGPVPIVRALGDSLNLATVNMATDLGLSRVQRTYERLTGDAPGNRYPSFVLGAEAMTPIEVLELYGAFASGGFHMPGKTVVAVLDQNGVPLTNYPFNIEQVIATAQVEALSYALEAVMQKGTGRYSRHSKRGVAGKTGTTNDNRDSWFAGYDARHVVTVWVGRDDNTPMGLTGSSGAMRVWDPVMSAIGVSPIEHPPSQDVYEFEYVTGLLAHGNCAEVVPLRITDQSTLRPKPGCGITKRNWRDRLKEWFD